ncbi:TlpA family protein disulfide reductase [Flavobacterium sp. S87F.05.LMB.W.Kidney.N]|uniref:TlpA family protein disulfide reductase n=1 Tax=Flavobacterium sp. S87F.05.LMB.W.Kidney.N TaxID=1278758 RepID=UPI001066A081|nr:TlpA disulfide reductase family protein [Flavobacterium sp. S87F.05.LMB.W.Kidney.N]TDX11242.1 AhpC/TSA family protein [Flavobacterium sp. S87F.05.LMB.W.Kidney.N]
MFKKIKNIKLLVLAICAFTLQVTSQEVKSRLQGMIDIPIPGASFSMTYDPKGGPLENVKNISGYAYVFNDYRWEIEDLKMKKNGAVYSADFTVPKNCAFMAFKFYGNTENGLVTDTNQDTGYMLVAFKEPKVKMPGADLAWATFRNKDFNGQFGGYFKDFTIDGDATEYWLKKEVAANGNRFPEFFDTYFKVLKVQKPEKFQELGTRFLADFTKKMNGMPEEVYLKVHNIYLYELKDKAKSDSVENVIVKQFPKGAFLRQKAYQKIMLIADASERNKVSSQFLVDFPYTSDVPDSQKYFYDNIVKMQFGYYFETKDYKSISAMIPNMNFANLNDAYHQNISKALYLKVVDPAVIEAMAVPIIKQMQQKVNDMSYMQGLYWSPNQATENAKNQLNNELVIQIRMYDILKKYKEVLETFELLPIEKRYEKASINDIHIKALEAFNKPILEVLKNAARANTLSESATAKLKELYLKEGKKEADFPAYLEQLKKENKPEEKIALMDPVPAPAIKVQSADGKTKDLALNSGKIIVIDFWATWCGPCKKAFPAMQQLVNNFKEDKQVEVYFISTQETKEGYKKDALAYLKEKGLKINTYFDLVKKGGGTNNASFTNYAKIFKSSGIPRKVVIKNRQIRFTSEGYSGNPGQLVDELTNVINALKNE